MRISWWNAIASSPETVLWIVIIALFGFGLWWLLTRNKGNRNG